MITVSLTDSCLSCPAGQIHGAPWGQINRHGAPQCLLRRAPCCGQRSGWSLSPQAVHNPTHVDEVHTGANEMTVMGGSLAQAGARGSVVAGMPVWPGGTGDGGGGGGEGG